MGADHPESPQRLAAIEDRLKATGLFDRLTQEEAPKASVEQLQRVHEPDYIRHLLDRRLAADERLHLDPDTFMNRYTADAALRAAGAVVRAVDRVLAGTARSAFCNVRPPGHHAVRDEAMGFCFFNNVAVGARHAVQVHGLQRVAIIDFDVHFGNGTADIFADDAAVMLCSSYQYPLYPLTGPAPGNDHMINVPLAPGSRGVEFREAVAAAWLPALEAFRPKLVFFSAGFDAHVADPLASLQLREEDFAWVTQEVLRVTRRDAGDRAISTLEGGYDLAALGRSAAAHVAVLMDPEKPLTLPHV
jgi:acetoin utilization deacetylase AcuC-like enzyme